LNIAAVAPVYPGDPVLTFTTPVMFFGSLSPASVTFSWLVDPTRNYYVQYKDDLNDAVWQDFAGAMSVIGNTEYAQAALGPAQRFYRVVVGN
jgi:hypothetical protein